MTAAPPVALAQWQSWSDRRLPEVEEVRAGVWSIPVPIPDHPMRYTLCYAFVGERRVLLLDPGWETAEGWDALVAGVARAGASMGQIVGIVVTHYHADHLGLAKRVIDSSGAWLALGSAERVHEYMRDFVAAGRRKFAAWGVPDELIDRIEPGEEVLEVLAGFAPANRWLADGEVVHEAGARLRVIATPGHSPGHICLVDIERGLLFTGDHVLPRISPNVPFDPAGARDPLGDYLDSLRAVRLDEVREVCPAHEYRFASIGDRCDVLNAHSLARTAEVEAVIERGGSHTVWDVARQLTWSRGWDALSGVSMRLALSETASHVRYLELRGRVTGVVLS